MACLRFFESGMICSLRVLSAAVQGMCRRSALTSVQMFARPLLIAEIHGAMVMIMVTQHTVLMDRQG